MCSIVYIINNKKNHNQICGGSRKLIRRDTLFCKYWLPEGKLVISCDIRYAADPVVATDRRPLTHSESSD